jgi:prophage DNA circulation protein
MSNLEVASDETLEDFLLIVETKLSEALQAELATIKGDIAELKTFVHEVREFVSTLGEQVASNPMLAGLLSGGGGFGGFQ